MRLFTAAVTLPLLLAPLAARARPSHFDIKVKATACGAAITCAVRSDEYSYKHAVVGLVPSNQVGSVSRGSASQTQAKVGVPTPTVNGTVPVTINVTYGKGGFMPGQKFHVISAWSGAASSHGSGDHVWGAVTTTSPSNEVTLPGSQTPAMKAAAKAAATQGKAQVRTFRSTQATDLAALKAKQRTQTTTLKAKQAAQITRLKELAQARRVKLDAKLAAATPRTPAATAARQAITADTQRVRSDLADLKYKHTRALSDLGWRQQDVVSTLQGRQSNALAKLQAKLGVY